MGIACKLIKNESACIMPPPNAFSPECLCHHREDTPSHYFLECFLYSPERQALFGLIEHYIPNFSNLTKQIETRNNCMKYKY